MNPLQLCDWPSCGERWTWHVEVHTSHSSEGLNLCTLHYSEVVVVLSSFRNIEYDTSRRTGA